MNNYCVGDRTALNNSAATIKFIGKLRGREGLWLGLEFDNIVKSPSDGVYLGQQYFACKEGHGSFVKIKGSDQCLSLQTAFESKYGNQDINYEHLKIIVLSSQKLCDPFPISQVASRLIHLDLSDSGISSLQFIDVVCQGAIHLKELTLSGNQLVDLTYSNLELPSLKILNLSRTYLSWQSINRLIVNCFRNLKCLNAEENHLSSIQVEETIPSLDTLILNYNRIESFDCLNNFKLLPKLRNLQLRGNDVKKVIPSKDFENLQSLDLSFNNIRDWHEIENIDKYLPSVTNLRIEGCQVLQNLSISESRIGIIARIGSLTHLDGSEITSQERTDSEFAYLKSVMISETDFTNTAIGMHRQEILYSRYGTLLTEFMSTSKQYCGVSNLFIDIFLQYKENIHKIWVSPNWYTYRLMTIAKLLFQFDDAYIKLYILKDKEVTPMEPVSFKIKNYGIKNGSKIMLSPHTVANP